MGRAVGRLLGPTIACYDFHQSGHSVMHLTCVLALCSYLGPEFWLPQASGILQHFCTHTDAGRQHKREPLIPIDYHPAQREGKTKLSAQGCTGRPKHVHHLHANVHCCIASPVRAGIGPCPRTHACTYQSQATLCMCVAMRSPVHAGTRPSPTYAGLCRLTSCLSASSTRTTRQLPPGSPQAS